MRFLYIAALIAGASFYFHDAVRIPFALDLIWKASGCALLALWAASRARNPDGWLLALAFAVYALADAMLDLAGLVGGAAAFIVGHLIMIAIYWRNRRPVTGKTRWMAALILLAVPLVAVALPAQAADRLLGAALCCRPRHNGRRGRDQQVSARPGAGWCVVLRCVRLADLREDGCARPE